MYVVKELEAHREAHTSADDTAEYKYLNHKFDKVK